MKTVSEVSKLSGVSVRTLHHYNAIGLLQPTQLTEAGYRLYDDAALERLQMILLFRELEFPLGQIRQILDAPDFDRDRALQQQAQLLRLKRERLDGLLGFVCAIQTVGVNAMDFKAFDTKTIEEYAAQAKTAWGKTDAYREFEQKSSDRDSAGEAAIADGLMDIFRQLGSLREQAPQAQPVQAVIARLQAYITANYYTCTPQILQSLGEMYTAGGSMSENIDAAGGAGTAQLAKQAIDVYCAAKP